MSTYENNDDQNLHIARRISIASYPIRRSSRSIYTLPRRSVASPPEPEEKSAPIVVKSVIESFERRGNSENPGISIPSKLSSEEACTQEQPQKAEKQEIPPPTSRQPREPLNLNHTSPAEASDSLEKPLPDTPPTVSPTPTSDCDKTILELSRLCKLDASALSPLSEEILSPRTTIIRGLYLYLTDFPSLHNRKKTAHTKTKHDSNAKKNLAAGVAGTSRTRVLTHTPKESNEDWLLRLIPEETEDWHELNWDDFKTGLQLSKGDFCDFIDHIRENIENCERAETNDFYSSENKRRRLDIVIDCFDFIYGCRLRDFEKSNQTSGAPVIPVWFMAIWYEKLAFLRHIGKHGKKSWRKGTTPDGLSEEIGLRVGSENISDPSSPTINWSPQAKDKYLKQRRDKATLDQSMLHFEPLLGQHSDDTAPVEILLAQAVKPVQDQTKENAELYSFELILNILETKLRRYHRLRQTEIRRGRILWIDTSNDGMHNEIRTQNDFDQAIRQLFDNRDARNILNFSYMPEPENIRIERLSKRNMNTTYSNILNGFEESQPTSYNERRLSAVAAATARHSLGSIKLSRTSTLSHPPRSPTKSAKSSTSRQSIRSRFSQARNSVSRIVNPLPRDSDKEGDAKWEDLAVIEKKTAFKIGGDDDASELDLDKVKSTKQRGDEGILVDGDLEEDLDQDNEPSNDNGNRSIAKLQDLLKLPELNQLDKRKWIECCEVFQINPEKTELSETVHIAGLKTKIYQYQAYGVYWQMLTSRKLGGGILADSMGLGKTLSFLAFFVVERQLCVLWNEVEKSRKMKDGRHLPEQHSSTDVCPSSRKSGWIMCPCASSSPTSRLPPKSGVRLACVPNELVKSWWAEWKKHVDTTYEPLILGLNIAINYKGAVDFKTSTSDLNKLATAGANINRLKISGKKDSHHSGWLVITSAQDFKPWVVKYFTSSSPLKSKNKWSIEFGIAMIDESHEEYFKGTGRGKILLEMPSTNQPFLWGYTGTPISQSPRGIEGVLFAIENHVPGPSKGVSGWSNHPLLKRFQWSNLDTLCKCFDAEIKKKHPEDSEIDHILAEFAHFLRNFVIRRDGDTRWFGHQLIKLNIHYHQNIHLKTVMSKRENEFREKIDAIEVEFNSEKEVALAELQARWDNFPEKRRSPNRPELLAFNTMCRVYWRSRVLATIPYASTLLHADDPKNRLDLTVSEALNFFRRPDHKIKNNPYYGHMRNIAHNSPKLVFVGNLIKQLAQGVDHKGDELKLIIMSAFPQIVFASFMFILKFFPELNEKIGVVMPGMKPKDRSGVLDAFTDALDEKGKRKQSRNNLILIGTTRLIGKGLQLTRAAHVVLMEPDYEFVNELQAYGRVHRIGQKNDYSHSLRLINRASGIEKVIIERQEARDEFLGKQVDQEETMFLEELKVAE